MNILELDSFNLSDAVKFHNRLNPKIWGRDEHLLPEVKEKLLEIAADFQEFLGISDLDVQDITISGSNAAYSYTPHSDIDLHLVVNVPKDEVYQELFNAKKYQYNDIHDIRIRGADVELYVQPADESPISLGEYSIKDDKWLEVPKRKRAKIDQTLVRHKYEDVKARIQSALKDKDADRVQKLIAKIKEMRQAGLDAHGEFGPENLAFKMLRKQGWIKRLYDHSAAAKDRELSLKEQPKQKFTYGFKTEDAGETWDGVNPTTCMFLNEEESNEQIVHQFIEWAAGRLEIANMPEIFVHADPKWSVEHHSFGRYEPDSHSLHVNMANRHLFDILRTTAHELAHCKQNEVESLPDTAGETGSPWENDAHAAAGIIMREFADAHPELFDAGELKESASGYIPTKKQAKDPRYSMALTVDIKPGQVGKEANKMMLDTDSQGKPAMIYKSVNQMNESKSRYGYAPLTQEPGGIEDELGNQEATGPEFPPQFPEGTTKIDVSDVYDWYKIGQKISDMDDIEPGDLGSGPPQTVITFPSDEAEQAYLKQFKRLGMKTHDIDAGKEHYHEDLVQELTDEFALLENEFISEIKMSPSNLRQEAAKTGARAGMEFEMIVPNAGNVDGDSDQEPDMDQDERARSFRDIRDFFHDGDYNGRRDVERLEQNLIDSYLDSDFLSERKREAWEEVADESVRDLVERDYEDDLLEQAKEEVLAQVDEFGTNAEELDAAIKDRFQELFDAKVDEIMSDMGREYDEAYEEWEQNEWQDIIMDWESDWLENEGIETMWDVSQNYDISWPHWTSSDEEMDIDAVAEDFSNAVGKPVNASRSYHGARREAGHYVVEPDGSLEGDDSDDAGLEFVSPPMPIDELIADLNKVKKWADRENCYTNDSTGLHINISVPNYSLEKLDYIKLALLMGDKYVLDQFGRAGNTYTKSAIDKIRAKIKNQPERAQEFLDKMRNGMGQLASKAIHSGTTDKYTSINTKDGYIEFRSPGGDWLNENFSKIENTLLRFTVALSAAINPQAYREEYLKKFYKLLEVQSANDPLTYFAKYAAGEMPKAALKSFVKQAQLQRKIDKDPTGGQQYWWRVEKEGRGAPNGAIIEVVATNKQEALEKAAEEWGYQPGRSRFSMMNADAYPIRPYDAPPAGSELERIERAAGVGQQYPEQSGNWGIWANIPQRFAALSTEPGAPIRRFTTRDAAQAWFNSTHLRPERFDVREIPADYRRADLEQQTGRYTYRAFTTDNNRTLGTFQTDGIHGSTGAMFALRNFLRGIGIDSAQGIGYEEIGRQREPAQQSGGGTEYIIFNMDDRSQLTGFRAANQAAAEREAESILRDLGLDPDNYDVRERHPAQRPQQQQDNWSQDFERRMSQPQQQPAAPTGAGREFAGWKVLLPTGEEVYRFSGVGNSQADANRIAAEWLRNNGMGVSGEGFEVVPVWREA